MAGSRSLEMIETVSASEPRWSATATDTPIASIHPGDEFAVETLDCRAGTISSAEDIDKVPDASHINPITGPIEIRGMGEGSVVSIRITGIHAVGQPLMLVRPGVTALNFVDSPDLEFPQVTSDSVLVRGTQVPLRPMVGFLATTPASGELASSSCASTGGNLDTPPLGVGAEVLLPVEVDGVGLFVGDVHLAQGDGELFLTGIESPAVVQMICTLAKDVAIPGPLIVSGGKVSIIGYGDTLDEAAAMAANHAAELLSNALGFSKYDAGFVLSASSDLRVCRFLPNYGSVCRVEVPAAILRKAQPRNATGEWLTNVSANRRLPTNRSERQRE
jgi:amidase